VGQGPSISLTRLVAAYDGFLLDAYGVLIDKTGPLPGAVAFVERLEQEQCPYLILTNSASHLPETLASDLAAMGFPTAPEHILTSGMTLGWVFSERGLCGRQCVVLGPAESIAYVERAGGRILSVGDGLDAEVVVIADQAGVTLEAMDQTLSLIIRRLDAGEGLVILLCNPDLIYPVARGRYGFTAGGLAAMLEAVIRERYPEIKEPIVRLGKPYRPIFEEAKRRLAVERLVMIGDQRATDIRGANGSGIDSVLVTTGLSAPAALGDQGPRPTWHLRSLVGDA
jgi:HAD superfamily hydrolase (TIGR01459 family)